MKQWSYISQLIFILFWSFDSIPSKQNNKNHAWCQQEERPSYPTMIISIYTKFQNPKEASNYHIELNKKTYQYLYPNNEVGSNLQTVKADHTSKH